MNFHIKENIKVNLSSNLDVEEIQSASKKDFEGDNDEY